MTGNFFMIELSVLELNQIEFAPSFQLSKQNRRKRRSVTVKASGGVLAQHAASRKVGVAKRSVRIIRQEGAAFLCYIISAFSPRRTRTRI
jgi:hypothetical protein